MRLTIEEARELYKQGALAKEIALREYSEGEILNDYTKVTELPRIVKHTTTTDLYAQLYAVYKSISEGRPMGLTTDTHYYQPVITIAWAAGKRPRKGTYVGRLSIDGDKTYAVFISTTTTRWCGRLGWENDGVYMGDGVLENRWTFRDREQAEHFVKHFWKELIQFELGDFHTVGFIDKELYG